MYNPKVYAKNLKKGDALRWIGVDLDDTLAVSIWPEEGIGEPIIQTIEWCNQQTANGYKIIVHTSRAWAEYKDIEKWLKDHGVQYREIHCGKPLYAKYVDDKAWCPEWLMH
jgi:hypothetical protein